MRTFRAFLPACMLALSACSVPATTASALAPAGSDVLPFISGAQWDYQVVENTQKVGTVTRTMSLLTGSAGQASITYRRTDRRDGLPDMIASEKLSQAGDTITDTLPTGDVVMLLKLPLAVGSSWKYMGAVVNTCDSIEDVATPYGDIRGAYRVAQQMGNSTFKRWYASGIGLVRYESIDPVYGDHIEELTAFKKP